jgi:hypothetical protein
MPPNEQGKRDMAEWLSAKRRPALILVLGLLGMLLLLFAQKPGTQELSRAEELPATTAGAVRTGNDYAAQVEARLTALVEEIDGVGRATVMVMLENSGEAVYAREEKRSLDSSGAAQAPDGGTLRQSSEDRYVLIENGYGQKEALVETQLEPKVRGVIIVCEGAGDAHVQQRLINVVTTALGISSTRVCVEKIK